MTDGDEWYDDAGNKLVTRDQLVDRFVSDIHDIKVELDEIRKSMVSQRTLAVYKWVLGGCCTLIAAGFYWAFETQKNRYTNVDGDRQEARHIVLEDRVNRHLITHPDKQINNKLAEIFAEMRHINRRLERIEENGEPMP